MVRQLIQQVVDRSKINLCISARTLSPINQSITVFWTIKTEWKLPAVLPPSASHTRFDARTCASGLLLLLLCVTKQTEKRL